MLRCSCQSSPCMRCAQSWLSDGMLDADYDVPSRKERSAWRGTFGSCLFESLQHRNRSRKIYNNLNKCGPKLILLGSPQHGFVCSKCSAIDLAPQEIYCGWLWNGRCQKTPVSFIRGLCPSSAQAKISKVRGWRGLITNPNSGHKKKAGQFGFVLHINTSRKSSQDLKDKVNPYDGHGAAYWQESVPEAVQARRPLDVLTVASEKHVWL